MKKTFDCIAFLDEAAENTRLRLSGLSVHEQVAYWRGRNRDVLAEHKQRMKENAGGRQFGFVARLEALRKQRKAFDCVEMKHQAQEQIRKDLEGKTLEEQIEYWRKGTQALLKRQAQLRKKEFQARG